MKRLLPIVLTVVLSIFAYQAMAQSSLFGTGKVTKQSYQQAGVPAKQPVTQDSGLQKVKEMLQAAQQRAAAKRAVTATTTLPTAVTSNQPTAVAVAAGVTGSASLQMQLSQLNQVGLLYRQQTDTRLENLQSKNNTLSQKVDNLNQVMGLLNQELSKLQGQLVTLSQQKAAAAASYWWQSNIVMAVLFLIVALLLLAVIALFLRPTLVASKPSATPYEQPAADDNNDADTEAEYDFMGSAEGIPAKLDLARAYLAMEDYHAAKHALEQVIAGGDLSQRTEAQELLNKIAEKS